LGSCNILEMLALFHLGHVLRTSHRVVLWEDFPVPLSPNRSLAQRGVEVIIRLTVVCGVAGSSPGLLVQPAIQTEHISRTGKQTGIK
jgi:hypothetical protein